MICVLLIVIQNALPCGDRAVGGSTMLERSVSTYKSLSHDKEHKDSCTPFCQCSCCATPSLQYPSITYNVFIPETVNDYIGYILSDVPQFPLDIWQPPRLKA